MLKPTTDELEAIHLPRPLRKQLIRHLSALKFGALTLRVEHGRVRFIEHAVSERATNFYQTAGEEQ